MRGKGEPLPLSLFSIFDSYDLKTLSFEFGYDIFPGFKMPTHSEDIMTKFKGLHIIRIKY
jgi:hypothetical protein